MAVEWCRQDSALLYAGLDGHVPEVNPTSGPVHSVNIH